MGMASQTEPDKSLLCHTAENRDRSRAVLVADCDATDLAKNHEFILRVKLLLELYF